ncbi:MAG: hypothetical protein MK135_14440 [Polyangiaceae bacterium]|nr:hypothetical protein [Polyangiaceae bacterium]
MNLKAIQRVLDLVQRELGCRDARLELGGQAPDAAHILSIEMPNGFRLVAIFEPNEKAPREALIRLRQLGSSFFETKITPPRTRDDGEVHLAQRRLDDELSALSGRTGATGAMVIDLHSPVIWGASEARRSDEDVDTLLQVAEISAEAKKLGLDLAVISGLVEGDRSGALDGLKGESQSRAERLVNRLASHPIRARKAYLLRARVLAEVRAWTGKHSSTESSLRKLSQEEGLSYFARSFAGIYVLVLYFHQPFSELHVEGTALHALPLIERHVLGLPPVDPVPPRGKVVRLPV